FFSSRRRHTRFSRDWSSDVCSSDLELVAELRPEAGPAPGGAGEIAEDAIDLADRAILEALANGPRVVRLLAAPEGRPALLRRLRSEERRVGKAWRARRSQDEDDNQY